MLTAKTYVIVKVSFTLMKASEPSIKEAIAGGKLQEKNGTDPFELELDNFDTANQITWVTLWRCDTSSISKEKK